MNLIKEKQDQLFKELKAFTPQERKFAIILMKFIKASEKGGYSIKQIEAEIELLKAMRELK